MSNRQDDALPELPKPHFEGWKRGGLLCEDGFTAFQMRAYARSAIASLRDLLDEQRRTIESLMAGMPDDGTTPTIRRIASLQARLDAAEADAARWQWARKQFRVFSLDMGGNHSYMATAPFGRIKGPSIDAAVDAAIEAARSAA